jgi:hypothetical protein
VTACAISFTTTLHDSAFLRIVRDLTGNVPGEGGLTTFPKSGWLLSIVIPRQPHFIDQPDDVGVLSVGSRGLSGTRQIVAVTPHAATIDPSRCPRGVCGCRARQLSHKRAATPSAIAGWVGRGLAGRCGMSLRTSRDNTLPEACC